MAEYDMTLCVGSDRKRIPANSAILRFTSPVFRAMLGPNFAEGAQLRSSNGDFELELPDDEAAATDTAISILHHTWKPPKFLPKGQLLPLAQVAHKYDCVAAIATAIRSYWGSYSKEGRIGSAFVFTKTSRFYQTSNDIICGSFESLRHLQSHVGIGYLPEDIIDQLTEARAIIRMRLAEAYGRLATEQQSPVHFYNHNRTQGGNEWKELASGTCSIGSMVADLVNIGDHVWPLLRPFVTQGLFIGTKGQVVFKDRNTEPLRLELDGPAESAEPDSDEVSSFLL